MARTNYPTWATETRRVVTDPVFMLNLYFVHNNRNFKFLRECSVKMPNTTDSMDPALPNKVNFRK